MTYVMLGQRFTEEEWESICTRCGLCCYEKYEEQGRIVFTDTPCRYLGEENRCKVYAHRLVVCNDCHEVTPAVVMKGELLPPECSYVELAARLVAEKLEAQPEEEEEPARARGRWWGRRGREEAGRSDGARRGARRPR